MLLEKYEFKIFTDYHQFYLHDADWYEKLPDGWKEQTIQDLWVTAPDSINIGTEREGMVPITIEIYDIEPQNDFSHWDQVNECSIDIHSGKFVILSCLESELLAANVSVKPGTYRARIYYGNLNSVSKDRLRGEDTYKVELWLGDAEEAQVLKPRDEK